MIKNITPGDLIHMSKSDGLVLQGCGGDPNEWLEGISGMLAEEGVLLNGSAFATAYVFQHDGLTNILFVFDDIKQGDLDIGRLAMWRLQSHATFGGTWLSDYIPNRLGINTDELAPPEEKTHIEDAHLEAGDCVPGGMDTDLKGKVIAIKADILLPEYRACSHQLLLATGGFGCSPGARGRAVFGTNIYSGEQERWDRSDILGVIAENTLPGWAHEKLERLREPREKESVVEKIRESKKNPSPVALPQKKHINHGPEH